MRRPWLGAEFKVVIDGGLSVKSGITEEYIALQQAEPDMIKTIAYLLAQTVALHFYEMCAHPRLLLSVKFPSLFPGFLSHKQIRRWVLSSVS